MADAYDAVLETLRGRGWCFGDLDQVRAVIMINSALADDPNSVLNLVEAELANMDLRSIGGKSLPEPSLLCKSSRILGPIVLQISSVRDISRSSLDSISKSSNGQRLLRFCLTDGHTEITAIEYSYIPSLPDDIAPGTKVRLENKVPVHTGIVCLSSKVLTILGGVVQSLYEEWKMNKKYSGLSRESTRLSRGDDVDGPPPFEKLQVGATSRKFSQKGKSSGHAESPSKSDRPTVDSGNIASKPTGWQQNVDAKANNSVNSASRREKLEEQPSGSETRPREVVEAVPVQNQAASQKLLHKMNQQNGGRHYNSRKHKGKGKFEDPVVYTLDEYERRHSRPEQLLKDELPNTNHDEELAWQLQNQLDLEDSHVQGNASKANANAEHLKMSMFNFERDTPMEYGRRGRGGGGRSRRRGRGRGRGNFH